MDQRQEITFEPVAWSQAAAHDLAMIADIEPRDMAIFRDRVNSDEFQLLQVKAEGQGAGFVIWSIEQESDGISIVINAAAARPVQGADITAELHRRMVELAQSVGARAVRCWTKRPGLVRKLESLGASRRYVLEIRT